MPVTLDPTNSLSATRISDAQRSETANVNHATEAGAVLTTGSSGNSSVTAEITGSGGNTSIHCADPASLLARLRGGHIVTSASDSKAFTVRADANLSVAVNARVHAEVFARVEGGELQNAGATAITSPCPAGTQPGGQLGSDPTSPTPQPMGSTAHQQNATLPRRRTRRAANA